MRTLGGKVSQSRLQSLKENEAPHHEKGDIGIEVAKDAMKKKERCLSCAVLLFFQSYYVG